jgi:hypothetical protein
MAIASFKTVVGAVALLIGGVLSLVGSLALAVAVSTPNPLHLWTGENNYFEIKANGSSFPLGAVSLSLGVFLVVIAWRKIRKA